MAIDRTGIDPRDPEKSKKYVCTRCGARFDNAKSRFFLSKYSPLYLKNDGYSGICVECANTLYEDIRSRYDVTTAMLVLCHYLDVYFSRDLLDSLKTAPNFSPGSYLAKTNGAQYKNKNFSTFLLELKDSGVFSGEEKPKVKTTRWKTEDVRNRNFVLHTVGYDCFEDDSYSDDDLRYLYNTMVEYIGDDTTEDPHKLQSIIAMVKTMLQREKIDRLINSELVQPQPDEKLLRDFSTVKSQYNTTINDIANENAISAKASGKKQAGTNTLSYIMKQMADDGFAAIKPNVYEAKMSLSFQEIAASNAKALIEELNLQSDDYAALCAEQAETIRT